MPDQTLRTAEVAKKLGRTVAHINHLVRSGVLTPKGRDRRGYIFDPENVNAYLDVRAQGADPAKVAGWAIQARAAVRALEAKVDSLYETLGIDAIETLSCEDADVLALYARAKQRISSGQETTINEMIEWAKILHNIDEPYLRYVKHVTGDARPWWAYLDVAECLTCRITRPQLLADPSLARAFRALLHARNQVRAVAYFYSQQLEGLRDTKKAFSAHTVDQEILALMKNEK